MFSSETDAINLVLESRIYLAGERIIGRVDVDFDRLREESVKNIRVKLRGSISTRIRISNVGANQGSRVVHQNIDIVRADCMLWEESTPISQQHVQFPFEFALPEGLPSSFETDSSIPGGTISYAIEVVADRHGLRFDRRIARVLSVLPTAAPNEVQDAMQLHQGWQGQWTTVERAENVKKHLWSDKSRLEIHLSYPAIPSFPIGVPIPISLSVATFTKPMSHDSTPSDAFEPGNQSLFPTPPTKPSELKLKLNADVVVGVYGSSRNVNQTVAYMGGFGADDEVGNGGPPPSVAIAPPQWIPEDGKDGKGRWGREVKFDTTLFFACTPTIQAPTVTCEYALDIDIRLPGLGNDFESIIPIRLNSGAGPSAGGMQFPMNEQNMLPPSYFSGENHVWDDQ